MDDLVLTPAQWARCRLKPAASPPRLALVNRKGGSGKTTSAVQLAAAFAAWGLRVRIVDGDAQLASASYWLPPQAARGYPTLLDVYMGDKTLAEVTAPTTVERVSIVPSLDTLGRIESERPPGSDGLLAAELDADAAGSDIVVLDAAPALGLVTVSMLAAATDVVLVLSSSTLDLVGAAELGRPLDLIRRRLNPDLRVTAVVVVDDDRTSVLSREMTERLGQDYPDALVHRVPHSVRAREAPGAHQTMIEYAPDNGVTVAYWQLAAALVPRVGLSWQVSPAEAGA
jgi:chromosome partitioning protein